MGQPVKSRDTFLSVFRSCLEKHSIESKMSVLVIGGAPADKEVLEKAGLPLVHMSNLGEEIARREVFAAPLDHPAVALDAENLDMRNESYDIVFAHEVLHHCRSPHRALCEMLRVSRNFVIFQEPHDSWFMRLLTSFRLTYPYELAAVVANGYLAGGVRDSQIPNFIYRWSHHEVTKCVASYLAGQECAVYAFPYWDFNATEADLDLRRETRIRYLTRVFGTRNFLRILRAGQHGLNSISITRRQGNKFLCCIGKTNQLKPWLKCENGQIVFDQHYSWKARTPRV